MYFKKKNLKIVEHMECPVCKEEFLVCIPPSPLLLFSPSPHPSLNLFIMLHFLPALATLSAFFYIYFLRLYYMCVNACDM